MLVMIALADCADDDGFAYPSVGHLAWKTGLSRSTVQVTLGQFREAAYLDGEPTSGEASTRYRIVVENLPEKKSWQRLKGRLVGDSGRSNTLPDNKAGSKHPARPDPPPCPIDGATLPDPPTRNKEEPSLNHQEPSGGAPEVQTIPPDLHGTQAAAKLIQVVQESGYELPYSYALARAIANAFDALVTGGKSPPSAYEFLVSVTFDEIGRGGRIDKFFYEDAKWRGNDGSKVNNSAGATHASGRAERNAASLTRTLARHRARNGDIPDANQRKDGTG